MIPADIRAMLPGNPVPTVDYAGDLWRWFMGLYAYTSDLAAFGRLEHWVSLVPVLLALFKIKARSMVRGDCDEGMCTILELLVHIGVPRDDLLAIRAASPKCDPAHPYDHAVAGWQTAGGLLIFDVWDDRTKRAPYYAGGAMDPGHRYVDAQRLPFRPGGWVSMREIRGSSASAV